MKSKFLILSVVLFVALGTYGLLHSCQNCFNWIAISLGALYLAIIWNFDISVDTAGDNSTYHKN